MASSHFTNIAKVKAALGRKASAIDAQVNRASRLVAAAAVREAKLQIKGSHPKGTKTPSAIGHPPTNITGNLRRSIKSNVSRVGFGTYKIEVGPTIVYGRAVELGHRNWETGTNYPYMAPAAKLLLENGKLQLIYANAVRMGSKA